MPLPKDTNKTFIKKAVKRWGNRYDYSLANYLNSRTTIVVICRKHQEKFEQTPKAHFAAKHHCCPLCYKEAAGSYQNEWRLHNKDREIEHNFEKFTAIIASVFHDGGLI